MSRLILDALRAREAAGKPILTGVIGAGHFGIGVVAQLAQAPGMAAAAVADLDIEAAIEAYVAAGYAPSDVVRACRASEAGPGRPVVGAGSGTAPAGGDAGHAFYGLPDGAWLHT